MHDEWLVAETKRGAEREARAQLERRGIESYLPLFIEWPKPAVGSEVQPLFPGYLFVRAPMIDGRVRWCPGIKGFVAFGDEPAKLDDSHIQSLRAQEGADGLMRSPRELLPGATMSVVRGPFRGFAGVLERRLPGRDRVLVLLHILQRETRVELPERAIARA